LAGLTSPVQNHTALIATDIAINPGVSTVLRLPGNYNTFLYTLKGNVRVGHEKEQLDQGPGRVVKPVKRRS